MSIHIINKQNQADGNFNGGAILEKKPIPFISEYSGKGLLPYSNLFYWAHAWSEGGSTIGEHPHQAFEIMSFVLKGNIRHYDSKNRKWIPLSAGDVQIIRAGNGISHAEHIEAGGEIFQIWFDPEIRQAMVQPATYDDYKANTFTTRTENYGDVRLLVGKGAPVKMTSEGIVITEKRFNKGEHNLSLNKQTIYSIFVLEGELTVNNEKINIGDFLKIEAEESLSLKTENCKLFIIESPLRPSYKTYAEIRG